MDTLKSMLLRKKTNTSIQFRVLRKKMSHLLQRVVEFTQDVVLIKDFALVAMLIVVVDFLPHVCWKLVEGHVLLDLFVLGRQRKADGNQLLHKYVHHIS